MEHEYLFRILPLPLPPSLQQPKHQELKIMDPNPRKLQTPPGGSAGLFAVRAALSPALADDIDDVSSTHSNTADGSNDSSDESYAPDSSGMHQRPKKPSAMRGARPNGFSYEAASKIDFSSSYSIHKHMPPYKGRGQLPFPTQSLLDSCGNVNPNLKFCWSKVADWRWMTAKQQKVS